ncbi:putative sulfoacetate transporter SauU [Paraburkholderia domus]|uniref:MFS transporter n=1 Tax=Paraburkholderia domus TaxID=2793075 RepID=UPI001913FB7F|nr:MFS transporter [Paraburkholderia domus]MBK5050462.1 MFS transporter [Burkholderia sp. R-70006]CAE6754545.1 putative sulfoacetate transporter SauU [Paraburkholderia domus]
MSAFDDKSRPGVIVALLFLFMVINFADKAVIGLAAVSIMHDLSLTPAQFGLVGSSFFLLYSISGVCFGFVANRVKAKWVLTLLALIWAVIQFPMVGTVTLPLLIFCRVVLGLGEGPAFPIALHACYKWFDSSKRTVPHAIVQQGVNTGMMVAGPILTFIIVRYGWHHAFLALGIVGIAWTVLWLLFGAEGRVDDTCGKNQPSNNLRARVPYKRLLADKTLIGNFMLCFVGYAVVSICFTWFPAYLRLGLGYSATTAGWLFSLIVAVQIPVTLALSWLSQKLLANGVPSRVARGAIPCIGIAASGLIFFATAAGIAPPLKVACLASGGVLSQLIFVFGPLMIDEVVPTPQRGALLAINNSIGTLAGLIAPAVMGLIVGAANGAPSGYEHGFVVLGGFLLVCGLVGFYLLDPAKSKARLTQFEGQDRHDLAGVMTTYE